jgi:hypothetical protein
MTWLLYAKNAILRIFKVAAAYPLQAAIVALLCLSAWLYWGKQSALDTVAEREATIAQMEQASEDAKAAALANAQRVKDEYERISENAKKDYAVRLADNRAAIERWKLQNRRGAASQIDSTAAPKVPGGITGAETLPVVPRGFVLLPESDLDKTADIQATLAALQEAARKAMAVETTPVE